MSLAVVFPGQGSQSVGMLAALAAEHAVVQKTFDEASAVLGYDLWALVQAGPEEQLNSTERTQPAQRHRMGQLLETRRSRHRGRRPGLLPQSLHRGRERNL